jgi:hypothetical protein
MSKMKKQLLSPLKMLGDMDQYPIPSQGHIFPCLKNYLHGNDLFKIFYDVAQNILKDSFLLT